jgi:hypothetical protein
MLFDCFERNRLQGHRPAARLGLWAFQPTLRERAVDAAPHGPTRSGRRARLGRGLWSEFGGADEWDVAGAGYRLDEFFEGLELVLLPFASERVDVVEFFLPGLTMGSGHDAVDRAADGGEGGLVGCGSRVIRW